MIWLRRAGAAVVSIALFALAMWLWDREPHVLAHDMQPIDSTGTIGHVVATSSFSLRVDGIVVAHSITGGALATDDRITSQGVFVIVKFHAMGHKKPYSILRARLQSGDYSFGTSGRIKVQCDRSSGDFQPMLWSAGSTCFELPKDRLAGARFVVGAFDQLSAEASVDLGLSKAKAAQLVAHAVEGYNAEGS
jgi:hypothetical protein